MQAMTFRSKFIYRKIPQANLKYLPKNAVPLGGVTNQKGWVRVRFDADWYRSANKKSEILFRGT
jgi:hypothetical protein